MSNTWHPQNKKNAKYTKTAPKTVLATSAPFSGSLVDPTIDSCPILNKYPITDNITTPNTDNIVQKYAFPEDTTAFISNAHNFPVAVILTVGTRT